MLYDPKWEQKTEADPLTLASLIAWLETQPTDDTYNWCDCNGNCLIGLYGTAIGINWLNCHDEFYKRGELKIACDEPHTFGAALDRARAFAASH